MFAYWPAAETEEVGSEINKSMARKIDAYKKFVFSRGDEKEPLGWNNSELVLAPTDEDITKFINGLKAQPGGDIHLAGGARLAQSLARLGLIDEYHLFVHPVVSVGAAWFDQIEDKRDMDLLSATAYEHGVVGLYYLPKNTSNAPQPQTFSDLL